MKAIVALQPGNADVLELRHVEEPQIQEGEVKIRVKAFGLNKAESYYRSGNYGTFVANQALGIEAAGEVVEDPSGEFKFGQKVVTAMGGMMFTRHGGYAEYVTVQRDNVVAIDSELAFEALAALPELYLTAWGALDGNLKIEAGQTLLIRGATSALGMAVLTYAKARGLTVLATTRQTSSVDKLKALGAEHVFIDDGEVAKQVRELYPEGVDNALEVVGAATVKDTMQAIRLWGQVVVVGLLGGAPVLSSFNLMGDLPNTVKLSFFASGLLGSDALPLHESPINWIAEQVESGAMPSIVSKVFNFDEIQTAHRLLDSNTALGKIVVKV
jgi:NADPH2:quinone reductase